MIIKNKNTLSDLDENPLHTKFKVFDILGREIAIRHWRMDEVKGAGIHHSAFHTPNSELTSGVYFYQLRSGSFIETKKMIYLK
ncbi:MAG: T9SS type A sorting domain-containing protein [Bacteroidetes bacterium]|nr:T9SS type A sorting domain-containing protein [Bacteroidota bacterium]